MAGGAERARKAEKPGAEVDGVAGMAGMTSVDRVGAVSEMEIQRGSWRRSPTRPETINSETSEFDAVVRTVNQRVVLAQPA